MTGKKGQITLFVILGIILVGGVLAYFLLRNSFSIGSVPARFQELNQYVLDCSKNSAQTGIDLLEKQGGYIYLPEFSSGSEFAPSSSQLDFFGAPVPYWYYVSGGNTIQEQAPSKAMMKEQLERFIAEDLERCSLSAFADRGFTIDRAKPSVSVTINDESVAVQLREKISASFGNEQALLENFDFSVGSKLGKLYTTAQDIYQHEKSSAFLEQYGVDVLRLYAPVDQVEISCAPKVWVFNDIKNDLLSALEANTQALKVQGNYYTLNNKQRDYFVLKDLKSDDAVQFLYSRNWPTKIEVNPSSHGILMSEPVGQEAGLGVLGFCYLPYHFVYDLQYPVMIQLFSGQEIFQFPVVVIIDKNRPRQGLPGDAVSDVEPALCKQNAQEITVRTYDTRLNPVQANIAFTCLNVKCDLAQTRIEGKDAVLKTLAPQCVNGFLVARADGYAPQKYQISTNTESAANIVLDKLYTLNVSLSVDGKESDAFALVYFSGAQSFTLAYPQQTSVSLSEGSYNISVFMYKNSSISLGAYTDTKCTKIPKKGILGFFGGEDEQCFDVNIPAQTVSNVVSGGGKATYYFVESELENSTNLKLGVLSLPTPKSVEDLAQSYTLLEFQNINVEVVR